MSAAERQRRHRQRRYRERLKAGRRVYPVEADDADVEVLADAGYSLADVIQLAAFATRNDTLLRNLLQLLAEANHLSKDKSKC